MVSLGVLLKMISTGDILMDGKNREQVKDSL